MMAAGRQSHACLIYIQAIFGVERSRHPNNEREASWLRSLRHTDSDLNHLVPSLGGAVGLRVPCCRQRQARAERIPGAFPEVRSEVTVTDGVEQGQEDGCPHGC